MNLYELRESHFSTGHLAVKKQWERGRKVSGEFRFEHVCTRSEFCSYMFVYIFAARATSFKKSPDQKQTEPSYI